MTPTDAALAAFNKAHDGCTIKPGLQAACLAYVAALQTDEATVERVATAIELCPNSSEHMARAALLALTPTAQKETGE